MKKHFIPLTALALMALVSCGGGNNPSSSASSQASQSASSSQTTQASDPSSEKSSESVSEKSSEETSASDSESSTESGSESSSESSSEAVDYAVAISNKNALTAEWHLGEADRAVEFDLAPRTNITQAIADGTLTIVSSNPEVVQVLGRNLHAAGEGTATITVTYGDKTDTVDITVEGLLGEPTYERKTLSDVMAVEDLVTSGSNKYSKAAFLTKVKVAVIGSKKDGSNPADKYGNLYVTDPTVENSEELVQVYGSSASYTALAYQSEGYYKFVNPKDFLTNEATKDIKVGDELEVIAIRADYNTTKEISFVIRSVNGVPVANRVVKSSDVAGFELTDNEKKVLYEVSGTISAWKDDKTTDGTKYGNFFLKTDDNEAVYVYGATANADAITFNEDGSLKFSNPQNFLTNEATKDLKIGDKVTLLGFRCDYKGTVELNGIIKTYTEPTPEPEAKTSLDGVAAGDKIDISELTVVAVNNKAYVVSDGVRGIYVYANATPAFQIADVISLKGNVEEYHGYLQVSSPEATKLEGKTPKISNATILTVEGADALKTATGLTAAKLYKWRSVAGKSGNYLTLNLAGSETLIEPAYLPDSFGIVEGKTYDIEAYFTAYDTKYNYATVVVTAATEVAGETPTVKTSLADVTADGQSVELAEVTVLALNKKGYAITDGTDFMYVYKNGTPDVSVGDVISLKGTTTSYNGIHQIGSPEATKLEDKSPKVVNPTVLTPEILDAFPEATNYRVGNVYTWKTTVGKAGNYLTLPVLGSDVVVEYTQLLDDISIQEGKSYTITAYYNGYETKNKYAQFTVVLAEPYEVTPAHTWKVIGNHPYLGNWNFANAPQFSFDPVSMKHTVSFFAEKNAAFKVTADDAWNNVIDADIVAKINDESIIKAVGDNNDPTVQKAGTFTITIADGIDMANKGESLEVTFAATSNRTHSWAAIGSSEALGNWDASKALSFDYDEETHKHTVSFDAVAGDAFKVIADRVWDVKELGADLVTKLNDETALKAVGDHNDPTVQKAGTFTITIDDDILTKENVADGFTISFKATGEEVPTNITVEWTASSATLDGVPTAAANTALLENGWSTNFGDEAIVMNGVGLRGYSNYLMLASKTLKDVAFMFNQTAFANTIKKVTITTGAQASNSAYYNVTFGADAAVSTAAEAGSGVNVKGNSSYEFTPAEGVAAKYFQIASTQTGYNGQIAKIVIEFEPA